MCKHYTSIEASIGSSVSASPSVIDCRGLEQVMDWWHHLSAHASNCRTTSNHCAAEIVVFRQEALVLLVITFNSHPFSLVHFPYFMHVTIMHIYTYMIIRRTLFRSAISAIETNKQRFALLMLSLFIVWTLRSSLQPVSSSSEQIQRLWEFSF